MVQLVFRLALQGGLLFGSPIYRRGLPTSRLLLPQHAPVRPASAMPLDTEKMLPVTAAHCGLNMVTSAAAMPTMPAIWL